MMKSRFSTVTVLCCIVIVVNGEVKKKDSNISEDMLRVNPVSERLPAPKYRLLEHEKQQNATSIAGTQEREEKSNLDRNQSDQMV